MEKIAVLIPCYNEEATIGEVVDSFARVLPGCGVYVCDNGSTDKTAEIACAHGASVLRETQRGKGCAVRKLFLEIDADVYLMVDGDSTYPAEFAKALIAPILAGEADMTVGDRLSGGAYERGNRRAFHYMGNRLVRGLVNRLYKTDFRDVLSGYRAMSRMFVKTTPIISTGFEIETEMTLHALDCHLCVLEISIPYKNRPNGSHSKLSTMSDGLRVIKTIFALCKDYKPLYFFSLLGAALLFFGLWNGISVLIEYVKTGVVPRLPTAVFAVGLVIAALLSFSCGLILDTIGRHTRRQFEVMRLMWTRGRGSRE